MKNENEDSGVTFRATETAVGRMNYWEDCLPKGDLWNE